MGMSVTSPMTIGLALLIAESSATAAVLGNLVRRQLGSGPSFSIDLVVSDDRGDQGCGVMLVARKYAVQARECASTFHGTCQKFLRTDSNMLETYANFLGARENG